MRNAHLETAGLGEGGELFAEDALIPDAGSAFVYGRKLRETLSRSAEQVARFLARIYPRIYRVAGVKGRKGRAPMDVERRQAGAKLAERTEVAETICRIGQLLSAELDRQKLARAVTAAAAEVTGARFGALFYDVAGPEGAAYMLYTLAGEPREAFSEAPVPRAASLVGTTFRGERAIRLDNVKLDPRPGKCSPFRGLPLGLLTVTSYLAVPVVSRAGELVGGLFLGHPEAGAFTERHERIVEGIALQAAIALDNARLYQEARQESRDREALLAAEQAARREAELASRAKDEFLGMLSHELRTPLNAIQGWIELLGAGRLDAETTARAIATIDRNARSQARLIEDMLDVSRIISGKLRLDAQAVDLAQAASAAVDTSRLAAEAKEIAVRADLDLAAGPVLGDPVRLQQVVLNLLSNAIKFTPRKGRVDVRLACRGSHAELTVADTGPGIEEGFLPYVFDRFRQADGASGCQGGLGLGLSIVRHLVEVHGGTVEAGNREGGQGAVFTVRLPLLTARAAAEPLAVQQPPPLGTRSPA